MACITYMPDDCRRGCSTSWFVAVALVVGLSSYEWTDGGNKNAFAMLGYKFFKNR